MRKLLFCTLLCSFICGLNAFSQDDVISARLMTYNIRHGEGMDGVIDLDRQATVILDNNPDVIGLQEVDSCVKRSSYVPQAAILGQKTGMYATFGGAIPLTGGKYGVAILSKEEPLAVHHMPLPGTEKRTLLVCEFENYVFATTHLDLNDSCRLASLDTIIEEAASWDKPFFICGDWNDEPTSTLIKTMKKNRLFSFLSYRTNTSTYYTFPAKNPTKIIDYIASYGEVVKSTGRPKVVNEPNASDHRPVYVDITLELPTGIQSISADTNELQGKEVYDLSGRKISTRQIENGNLPKGIYVLKNERKLIMVK